MAVVKEELLQCCVWLVVLLVRCTALMLSPCVNDGNVRVAEVERGKTSSFTCRGFNATDSVNWDFLRDSDSKEFSAGVCPALTNSCQLGDVGPTFTASRSATESVMTVDPSQREDLVRQGTLRCGTSIGTDTCRMDLTTPAVVSTCSVKFERVGNVWRTTGRCDMSSAAYSSRGRYTCRWYRQKGSTAKEEIKQVNYTPSSRVCNFTASLPTADGVYTYSVTVTPGQVSKQASFTGEHPSAPTMTGCSADDYIAENTAVSCTCSTVNVGQPAGRLVWYRAGVPIAPYGNYGDDTLTVSQRLTRADHDVTQFRCDVDWATDVQGESRTFKVGYKPERLSFKLGSGSQTEVTVKENSNVPLACEADGRPVANMTVVRQEGTEIRSGQSPLTLTLTANCTDTGTYLCSATNVIGQADTSVSAKLYVECKPRFAQTEPALELNFRNQPDSRDFDVIAYPTPKASFSSFRYLGPNGTDPASEFSNIRLTATCQQKPDILYISTCTFTVHSMTSPAAAGFYTVTLSNTEGFHDVRFKVLYNAAQSDDTTGKSPPNYVAVGLGAVLLLVLVVNVVFVVWLWRRRWILPWAHEGDQPRRKSTSERESSSMDLGRQASEPTGDVSNPYDVLNTADIGQRSIYSEFTHHTRQEHGNVYQNA